MVCWDQSILELDNALILNRSITMNVKPLCGADSWSLTVVYGQHTDQEKQAFLDEIKQIHVGIDRPWLIIGDFNLIYQASDKNNLNLNRRRMGQFRALNHHCELKELHLQDRRYTWSNGQRNPTLERIDKALCNPQWELIYLNCMLRSLSSSMSDHCPLLISDMEQITTPRKFEFENYWPLMSGYSEVVHEVWSQPVQEVDPIKTLVTKMQKAARALRN